MAVKKSRTGKKKRPQYGPQGQKTNEAPQMTPAQFSEYKQARNANYAAIACLIVAMVLLIAAPNIGGDISTASIALTAVAYAVTMVGGALILYTSKYVVENREKMTRITGFVMIFIGAFGLFTMGYSLFQQ